MNFIKKPLDKFIQLETSSSIILFTATVAALILANSPLSESFLGFWKNEITISIPGLELSKPILKWINDGLMAIFFFLIGLEIKREILTGELSQFKKASLPIFAAIGGMLIPALLFSTLNYGKPGAEGWGIPMAADIAFSLGILTLLGSRVPSGLKIFLMAFAIIDDLGAVLVIAFFYSSNLVWAYIGIGLAIVVVLMFLSNRGYYSKYVFLVFGIVVWVLFLKSGMHATIAGVLLALTVPLQRKTNTRIFYAEGKTAIDEFSSDCKGQEENALLTKKQLAAIDELEDLTEKTAPPLQYLEHRLHGWVSYIIMPLFAFANAGVVFNFTGDSNFSLTTNIAISMVIGNIIGIFLFSFLSIKLNFAELPENVSFKQLAGISILGGLGFTMSLFINSLAFTDQALIDASKMGILFGSIIAGAVGYIVLKSTLKSS
jgi:NhaA family Na+:H+ antiporter